MRGMTSCVEPSRGPGGRGKRLKPMGSAEFIASFSTWRHMARDWRVGMRHGCWSSTTCCNIDNHCCKWYDQKNKRRRTCWIHADSTSHRMITYAMLDNCSTGTFILEDLRQELNVDGVDSQISITTMNGNQVHNVKVVKGLTVTDLDGDNSISLPKAFTKLKMPATNHDVPRPELARKWPHLARVAAHVQPLMSNVKIGLLIGTNCPEAIEPKDFVTSQNGGPYAVKMFAGWTIIGPLHVSSDGPATVNCNRIVVKEIRSDVPVDHYFCC